MLRRPGSSWVSGALLKDTSVVVLKEERALVIHSPTNNPCRTWDSNPQPLDYESDSLTIRPRLPLHSINRVCAIANLKVKVKLKSDRAFQSSFSARILIAAPWCPHFIYSIITQRYNCARKYWNIYFPCVSFLWANEMSRTVKHRIRAELNIIIHVPSK